MAKNKGWLDYKGMKQKLEEAKERMAEIEENFEESVEEHPLQSVAIAFGVGVLTGAMVYMMSRKK
jgi:ElaB/YqjD/DUF883 family membrane-anchored ribosome-binding protein